MADRTKPLDMYLALAIRVGYSPASFHHTDHAKTLAREAAIEAGQPAPDDATRQLALDSVLRADELLGDIVAAAAQDWKRP